MALRAVVLINRVFCENKPTSATPVSTGSNLVCASPEGPRKCYVSVFSFVQKKRCVTNLYIVETCVKYSVFLNHSVFDQLRFKLFNYIIMLLLVQTKGKSYAKGNIW